MTSQPSSAFVEASDAEISFLNPIGDSTSKKGHAIRYSKVPVQSKGPKIQDDPGA